MRIKDGTREYLKALALAHMLAPAESYGEDRLAEIITLGKDEGRWSERDIERAQRWACGPGPWTI